MLLNKLYFITDQQSTADGLAATLALVPDHPVFRGHFPGHPVLPGACMVQMVKELAEQASGSRLLLKNAPVIKFLSFINPDNDRSIRAQLKFSATGDRLNVNAQLLNNERTFFKFTGVFQKIS